jgi:DNA mismatch endonuclease, patch repair protein
MRANRRRDTGPELALRRVLHRRGLRFRVDFAPVKEVRCRADLVFTKARLAVFVDGCFWHFCPEHGNLPKYNRTWWQEKLRLNVSRDRLNDDALVAAGWHVVRVWEHEPVEAAADRVCDILGGRQSASSTVAGHVPLAQPRLVAPESSQTSGDSVPEHPSCLGSDA